MNSKSTKILLVEDNPADARYTKELLPATQYSLIGANSLAEALECVRDTRVDVVLLDLALPDSMGVETVAKLIAQRKELPIVVLTGLEDVECAIEALRIGAHDYIVKGKLNEELLIRSIDLAIEAKKHQLTRDNLLSKTRLNKLSAAVGEALITCHSVTDFLEKCAEALHQHLGLIHAHIWTLNDHLNEIHLQAVSGECKDMKPGSTYVSHQTKNLHQLSTEALAEITDLLAKKTIERCEINSNKDWAAVLVVEPLISDDRLFGFLTLHMQSNADTIPQPSLKILAEQIAMGLDKKLSEAARALLANIVQCSEDGIISSGLDGKIKTWNEAAERIFGYGFEEAIGKDISLFLPEENNPSIETIQNALVEGKSVETLELTARKKNGQYQMVSLTVSALQDNSNSVYGTSMIVRDISAQKLSEKIEKTHTRAMEILNACDSIDMAAPRILKELRKVQQLDMVDFWLPETLGTNLGCLAVSTTGGEIVEKFAKSSSQQKLARKTSLPGMALESGEPVACFDIGSAGGFDRKDAALKAKLKSVIAYPVKSGDQRLAVIELFSSESLDHNKAMLDRLMKPLCYHIGQFIERKKAEEAARQATRAQLKISQAITQNAPSAITWLDKNLAVSEANLAFCNQFAIQRNNAIGSLIFQLATGIPEEWLTKVLEEGRPFNRNNYLIEQESTEENFCDLTIWPVMDETEKPDGLVILTIDVTERVELARQKEDFVATLSHDLKNPLIGQLHVLEGLLEGKLGQLNAAQFDVLSIVHSGTTEVLDLIKMLLDVYRYQDGNQKLVPEEFDLHNEIASIINQYKPLTERRDLTIDAPYLEKNIRLTADKMAIRRVVSNLINNSIKFTSNPGSISISCKQVEDMVKITVKDNGYGIPESELPFLFERFSKGKSHTQNKAGTGLGLYLCMQIVEKHGGSIGCKSEKDAGTEIYVILPENYLNQKGKGSK